MEQGMISHNFDPATVQVPHGTPPAAMPARAAERECRDCGEYVATGCGLCSRCAESEL